MTSHLKNLIKKHNSICDSALTWETATNLNATATGSVYSHPQIPDCVKKEACDAALLMERAEEEILMVKDEMRNTITHYIRRHEELSRAVLAECAESQFQRGSLSLLHMARFHCEKHLIRLSQAFTAVDLPQLPSCSYSIVKDLESLDECQTNLCSSTISIRQVNMSLLESEVDEEESEEKSDGEEEIDYDDDDHVYSGEDSCTFN